MDKKLSILLVEDDEASCRDFINCADQREDMTFVGVTNNSSDAIGYIKDCLPDAVILDLELHLGRGNGLFVLQELRQMALPVNPYVLVTTNNTSSVTYESARQLGADFIISKHQPDYSAKGVLDFLLMMRPIIHSRIQNAAPEHATTETPQVRNKRILSRIRTELTNVGISPKAVGNAYLIDAIDLVVKQPVQNLCTIIGQKYGKTESSVERAMQNAINRAWRTADIDDLLKFYTARIHSDKGVPTLTEFIYYYANKIKAEY
ncbi:sporulation initiation factor Spo0A C-terminal domain-containing protein [Oscillospiraceae bacterium WX1]